MITQPVQFYIEVEADKPHVLCAECNFLSGVHIRFPSGDTDVLFTCKCPSARLRNSITMTGASRMPFVRLVQK